MALRSWPLFTVPYVLPLFFNGILLFFRYLSPIPLYLSVLPRNRLTKINSTGGSAFPDEFG